MPLVSTKQLDVLVTREGEWWIAQCLQHDIATQTKSLDDVLVEIERVLEAHVTSCKEDGIEPFQVPPAPQAALEMFRNAKVRLVPSIASWVTTSVALRGIEVRIAVP